MSSSDVSTLNPTALMSLLSGIVWGAHPGSDLPGEAARDGKARCGQRGRWRRVRWVTRWLSESAQHANRWLGSDPLPETGTMI